MDKRELRIGNLIYIHGKPFIVNSIIKTDSVSGFELYIEGNDDYDYSIYAEPIPLNEEWLLKFGGSKHLSIPFYVIDTPNNGGQIYINPEQGGIIWLRHDRVPDGTGINPVSCKYVHQLQNLYFALTGEELEIKSLVQ